MFRDAQQARLFFVLLAATVFDLSMVLYRIYLNRGNLFAPDTLGDIVAMRGAELTFMFLFWNLVLAWVPYIAALRFGHLARKKAPWLRLLLVFSLWFAFFPNAPYIVTDLVHLRPRPPIPFWLDLMLLFSCAFTGLMLGLLSLYEVHQVARKWLSERMIWAVTLPIIALCGFGVWLGRVQRWNSWDIVTNPMAIFKDIAHTLAHKAQFLVALQITVLLSVFLLLGYSMLVAMMGRKV
jgi:uncharacterized membrane protein